MWTTFFQWQALIIDKIPLLNFFGACLGIGLGFSCAEIVMSCIYKYYPTLRQSIIPFLLSLISYVYLGFLLGTKFSLIFVFIALCSMAFCKLQRPPQLIYHGEKKMPSLGGKIKLTSAQIEAVLFQCTKWAQIQKENFNAIVVGIETSFCDDVFYPDKPAIWISTSKPMFEIEVPKFITYPVHIWMEPKYQIVK